MERKTPLIPVEELRRQDEISDYLKSFWDISKHQSYVDIIAPLPTLLWDGLQIFVDSMIIRIKIYNTLPNQEGVV